MPAMQQPEHTEPGSLPKGELVDKVLSACFAFYDYLLSLIDPNNSSMVVCYTLLWPNAYTKICLPSHLKTVPFQK